MSDKESMIIVLERMAFLVQVVTRCDIYETLYPTHANLPDKPLHGSMVDLYVSILECLCFAKQHRSLGLIGE